MIDHGTCITQEKNRILSSLKTRASLVYERFNKIPGVFCNPVEGAMYAFPRIEIPENALKLAEVKYTVIVNHDNNY